MRLLILLLFFLTFSYGQDCQNRLFTLQSAPGATIGEFINNLSDECGFSVIIKDRYAQKKLHKRLGRLTLKNVPLQEIFHIILDENDLDYVLKDNILKISYLLTKTFHIDYVTSKRVGQTVTDASVDVGGVTNQATGSTSQKTRDINMISSKDEFDFWKTMKKELYDVLNRPEDEYKTPQPIINENAGLVTVTATKKQIVRLKKYIQMIEERLHKEVLIDVSILAVFLDEKQTTGIDWSRFSLTLNGDYDNENRFSPTNPIAHYQSIGIGSNFKNLDFTNTATTIINASFHLSGLLDFLKKNGKVVTLSNPKILTLNNQPAIITIGDTLNYNVPTSITISSNGDLGEKSYTPSSIFVGILLNITPEITENGNIILRINPSISELRNPENIDKATESGFREIAPDTKEKKISSVVKVKDGSTLILGGLISNTKNFTINGVPVLKDVPLFGNLFKSSRKNFQRFELIFVLRPHIIKDDSIENIGLKDLGYTKLQNEK